MNQQNQSAMKFLLKLWSDTGTVKRWHSSRIKRIFRNIKAEEFQKAYVKVVYGKEKDVFGKIVVFYNDGFYETRSELLSALKAFTESNRANKGTIPARD